MEAGRLGLETCIAWKGPDWNTRGLKVAHEDMMHGIELNLERQVHLGDTLSIEIPTMIRSHDTIRKHGSGPCVCFLELFGVVECS